jgi:hypothetical protein
MDTRMISIIGLLLVILIGVMLGNSDIVGYSSNATLIEYPYEGFSEIKEKFEARDQNEKKNFAEAFSPMESTPIKVSGFSGLQSGAYGDEKAIGFMYNNDSGSSCKPYGYTNSKGNICLSESDIKLLTTRGGNALGASDQIGK